MWMLNRKTRYEIIKEIISNASDEYLRGIINSLGFECSDINYRRGELLKYLDEMNTCWNENYTDMIDRQYIKIK